MTVMKGQRAVLAAAAYLRIDLSTGLTDAVCGEQVDYVLVEVYLDDQVRAGAGGRYEVTHDEERTIRLAPLAGRRVPLADWYQHATQPDGRTSYPQAPVEGTQVRVQIAAARGEVHTLRDGTLVRVWRGRCAETWTPLPQAPPEHS
ncbi:hypothetical protein OG612_45505 (plasmid) [Streptomyces sp. NBC_01527]|uniref:hypothetical protein n=1 Tax=Streptomyces sp. NBC_01527 TaxID=2903894 RepID=UPI002F909482